MPPHIDTYYNIGDHPFAAVVVVAAAVGRGLQASAVCFIPLFPCGKCGTVQRFCNAAAAAADGLCVRAFGLPMLVTRYTTVYTHNASSMPLLWDDGVLLIVWQPPEIFLRPNLQNAGNCEDESLPCPEHLLLSISIDVSLPLTFSAVVFLLAHSTQKERERKREIYAHPSHTNAHNTHTFHAAEFNNNIKTYVSLLNVSIFTKFNWDNKRRPICHIYILKLNQKKENIIINTRLRNESTASHTDALLLVCFTLLGQQQYEPRQTNKNKKRRKKHV